MKNTLSTLAILFIAVTVFSGVSHAKMQLSDCAEFDTTEEAIDAVSTRDKATIYLNGALNQLEATINGPLKPSEIKRRDTCVALALANGADPNNHKTWAPPLLMATSANDTAAARLLLAKGANPNTRDVNEFANQHLTVLQQACDKGNQALALALLDAGADPTADSVLWDAAGYAEVQVVNAMLKSGKISRNQLTKFSEYPGIDDAETALDASETRVAALKQYSQKLSPTSPLEDKLDFINGTLLYVYYIGQPTLDEKSDPDAYVRDLLQRQTQVSDSLRTAGWVCHQKNCGITD